MTDSENIKANFPFPLIPRNPGLPDFNCINERFTVFTMLIVTVNAEYFEPIAFEQLFILFIFVWYHSTWSMLVLHHQLAP